MAVSTPFNLRTPCGNCPFRLDVPGYLRRARATEIAESLANGGIFPCHKTTIEDPDDEGALVAGPDSQFCAGALICMELQDAPNQVVRIAENLGSYDRDRLDMDAPVASSFFEFRAHHGEDEPDDEEQECCSFSGGNCEAPAGMLIGGVAVPVEPTGEVHGCPECGEPVCDACSGDDGRCRDCASWDDDPVKGRGRPGVTARRGAPARQPGGDHHGS